MNSHPSRCCERPLCPLELTRQADHAEVQCAKAVAGLSAEGSGQVHVWEGWGRAYQGEESAECKVRETGVGECERQKKKSHDIWFIKMQFRGAGSEREGLSPGISPPCLSSTRRALSGGERPGLCV